MKTLILLSFAIVFTATAAIDDGLVAYYPFDGNANDLSANAAHGSNYWGLVTYGPGRWGQAAWFDGHSAIKLPQARLLDRASNATISAWINFRGDGEVLCAGNGNGLNPISMWVGEPGAREVGFSQVTSNSHTFIGFSPGDALPGLSRSNWHMFTILIQSQGPQTVFYGYVDGNVVKTATNTSFSYIGYNQDMIALVGAQSFRGIIGWFFGGIDELRIYDRALSDSEILYLVNQTASPYLSIEVSQVKLCWFAPPDKDTQLQYRSALTGMEWVNVGGVVTNRGEKVCIVDAADGPKKFYRVVFAP